MADDLTDDVVRRLCRPFWGVEANTLRIVKHAVENDRMAHEAGAVARLAAVEQAAHELIVMIDGGSYDSGVAHVRADLAHIRGLARGES